MNIQRLTVFILLTFIFTGCSSFGGNYMINRDICKKVCVEQNCSYEGFDLDKGCFCGEKKELRK